MSTKTVVPGRLATTSSVKGASGREIILRFNRGLIGLSLLVLLLVALLPP